MKPEDVDTEVHNKVRLKLVENFKEFTKQMEGSNISDSELYHLWTIEMLTGLTVSLVTMKIK